MPTPIFDGPEFLVNTTTLAAQSTPTITALPDGRFVVVWKDNSETGGDISGTAVRGQIFAANGAPLGAEFLINTTTTSVQTDPTITALPDGRFVAAWSDNSATGGDTTGVAVRGQIFGANGAPSGAEFLINTTTAFSQQQPTITALPDGRFVVAWTDSSATGGDISASAVRGQIFEANGAPSGAEFLINTATAGSQYDPAITALPDGRFVVAWGDTSLTGGDTSGYAVRGQIFAANGAPSGAEFRINTTTINYQYQPTITALPDGRFVAAWLDTSASDADTSAAIRGQIFATNGVPSGAEFRINTTTAGTQSQPTITALPDGRFVVAWTDSSATGGDTSVEAIRGQVFGANGAPSGAEFLINTTTTGFQSEPTITALPDGRFVVAWTDNSATGGDTSGGAVRAQIFDPRVGVVEVVNGTSTQPRQLGSYDLVDVMPGAALIGQNASAIRSATAFETHATVQVDGTVRSLSSGPVIDAIRLTGTATGTATGLGGHTVSIGAEGVVRSSHGNGVTLAGTGTRIENHGEILAGRRGVEVQGGDGSLVNHGTITGGDRSFLGSADTNTVRNAGTMIGNVSMQAGDDVFDGRGGHLDGNWYGSLGNDRYDGRGASVITGAIYGGDDSDTLLGGDGDEAFHGSTGNDRLSGLGGDDSLYGGDNDDTLYGGAGEDTVLGGSHLDLIYGGAAEDSLLGDGSSDTVYGGLGDDTIDGGSSADVLYGGWEDDIILGGTNNDTIYGGAGSDTVSGGSGLDAFAFATAIGVSVDVITDFSVADDTIWLEDHVFSGLASGALAGAAFVANTSGLATTAAHRVIYESDTGALFFDADGSGSGARVQFATLGAGLGMTAADFVVV